MFSFLKNFILIALIWVIADYVSIKTKAILASIFTGLVMMMIAAWTGIIPADFMSELNLVSFNTLAIALMLVNMGSVMKWKQLKSDWKTILITCGGLIALLAIYIPLGSVLIGKEYTITGLPIIFGGGVAGLVMTSQVTASALPNASELMGFIWFLVAAQMLVGIPISTLTLKKYGKRLIAKNAIKDLQSVQLETGKPVSCILPEKFQTPPVLLGICAAIALLGTWIGQYSNKYLFLHENIVVMLLGFAAVLLRLIPENALVKANSSGIVQYIIYIYFGSLITENVTVPVFLSLLKPILLTFLISVPIVILGGVIMGKLLKVDPWFAAALMSSCLTGFPMTITMSEEAAEAVGRNPEEVAILKQHFVPSMVIAGLFTVSCFSGVIASILGNFL